MRRSRVAIGSERANATSRTPTSSCRCASAIVPPITIAPGLKKLMHWASTAPRSRPAPRTACTASGSPALHQRHDVLGARRRHAVRAQAGGHGVAARDRLQAAGVAAAADDVVVVRQPHVADVARAALRAAMDPAPRDDPGADRPPDLDEQQVLDLPPVRPVLAQGHGVDRGLDQGRDFEARRQPVAGREVVPARRQPDADAAHRGGIDPRRGEQLPEPVGHQAEQHPPAARRRRAGTTRSARGAPARSQTATRVRA